MDHSRDEAGRPPPHLAETSPGADEHFPQVATVVTDAHGIRHAMTPAGAAIVFDVHRLAAREFAAMMRVRCPGVCLVLDGDRGTSSPSDVRITHSADVGECLPHPSAEAPDWGRALVALPTGRIWTPEEAAQVSGLIATRALQARRYPIIEPPLPAHHDPGCSWGLNPPVSSSDLAM